MTLLIALLLIEGLNLPRNWMLIALVVWIVRTVWHYDMHTTDDAIVIPSIDDWQPSICYRKGNLLRYGNDVIEIMDDHNGK
jgi:hypothetical protein